MIFTQLARVIAILGLLFGIFHAVIGFGVASGSIGEMAIRRYTTADNSGQLIDKSVVTILVSIAFGALAEIGFAVKRHLGTRL